MDQGRTEDTKRVTRQASDVDCAGKLVGGREGTTTSAADQGRDTAQRERDMIHRVRHAFDQQRLSGLSLEIRPHKGCAPFDRGLLKVERWGTPRNLSVKKFPNETPDAIWRSVTGIERHDAVAPTALAHVLNMKY